MVLSLNPAQQILWNCSLFYQNQKCLLWWAEADRVQLHREMVPEGLDMNLQITWSTHFSSRLIFNLIPAGNCCTSHTAGLPSTVAPVLNLQENSHPDPKEKSLSIKPGADLWSIKPPSMRSHCELKLKLISPARPIFFCSATKCRRFIIQTSQGFV